MSTLKICTPNSKEKHRNEDKVRAIYELRDKYSLDSLLSVIQMAKSSFSYSPHHIGYKQSKVASFKPIFQSIFEKNHLKYAYIRMT